MLYTFIIHSNPFRVIIQAVTKGAFSDFYFGEDITIEMWEDFILKYQNGYMEKKVIIKSINNQPDGVESTSCSITTGKIKFIIKYKNGSEYVHIIQKKDNYEEFAIDEKFVECVKNFKEHLQCYKK